MIARDREMIYASRDDSDPDTVWIWRKPQKGNAKPINVGIDTVNYQRPWSVEEWESWNAFKKEDFKKIFGILPKRNKIIKIDAYKKNISHKKVIFRVK